MRWVRPDLTTDLNCRCFFRSARASSSSAGRRSTSTACVAATWIADGNTSFDDCDALTSSFGCTGLPSAADAMFASTSFVFMFDDVPDPVWNTSIGKWSSHAPVATSSAASAMARATSRSTIFNRAFTSAAAPLICASAAINPRSMRSPEMGKFSTARCVCAPQRASAGTLTSPMESCSILYSVIAGDGSAGSPAFDPPGARLRLAE